MNPETVTKARSEVSRMAMEREFNWAILLVVDSEAKKLGQSFYFGGHPSDWTKEDTATVAGLLCEQAACIFKSPDYMKVNPVKVNPPKRIALLGHDMKSLTFLYMRLWIFEPSKAKYFWIQLTTDEIGLSISFRRNVQGRDKNYWSLRFLLGALVLRLTGDE